MVLRSQGSTAFGDRDSHKGRVVNLQLEQNYFTSLEQLQVWHRLDETSPLYRMRHKLHLHLDGIEVSVSAVDMASLQTVMFYKRYEKSDFVREAVFENTLTESNRRTRSGAKQLETDHSKLDLYVDEDPTVQTVGSTRNLLTFLRQRSRSRNDGRSERDNSTDGDLATHGGLPGFGGASFMRSLERNLGGRWAGHAGAAGPAASCPGAQRRPSMSMMLRRQSTVQGLTRRTGGYRSTSLVNNLSFGLKRTEQTAQTKNVKKTHFGGQGGDRPPRDTVSRAGRAGAASGGAAKGATNPIRSPAALLHTHDDDDFIV